MMQKTVIAKLDIKQSEVEKFIALAQVMISETTKEDGCFSYNLYKDCFSEQPVFLFYEEYRDDEALNLHNNSDYLKDFFKGVTPLLNAAPSIKVL